MKIKFDTNLEGLKETAPIQPAIKFIPEWFKKNAYAICRKTF